MRRSLLLALLLLGPAQSQYYIGTNHRIAGSPCTFGTGDGWTKNSVTTGSTPADCNTVTATTGDGSLHKSYAFTPNDGSLSMMLTADMRSVQGTNSPKMWVVKGSELVTRNPALTDTYRTYTISWIPASGSSPVDIWFGGYFSFASPGKIDIKNVKVIPAVSNLPNLVVSGSDFSSSTTWPRSGVTVGGDKITLTAAAGDSWIRQDFTVTLGKSYVASVEINNGDAVDDNIGFNLLTGGTWAQHACPTSGTWKTYSTVVNAVASTSLSIYFGAYGSFSSETIQARNVTLQEIPGY